MATNIPPHNLTRDHRRHHPAGAEARHARCARSWRSCRVRISRPAASFWAARAFCDYFTKGRGSLKLRAKAATEKFGKDREAIIVTEIPYQVNKARLIETRRRRW